MLAPISQLHLMGLQHKYDLHQKKSTWNPYDYTQINSYNNNNTNTKVFESNAFVPYIANF